MDKYFNVHFICDTNNNEWWSNHASMSMQLSYFWINIYRPPPPPPPLCQTTNDRGVFEQTTVPSCAQTTLAALAKPQFGGWEWHLCHTLELRSSWTIVMIHSAPKEENWFVLEYLVPTFLIDSFLTFLIDSFWNTYLVLLIVLFIPASIYFHAYTCLFIFYT